MKLLLAQRGPILIATFMLMTTLNFQNCAKYSASEDGPSAAVPTNPNQTKDDDEAVDVIPIPLILPVVALKSQVPAWVTAPNFDFEFAITTDPRTRFKSILCTFAGIPPVPCTSDKLSLPPLLNEGIHSVTIIVTDSENQKSQPLTFSFGLNMTAPRIFLSQKPAQLSANATETFIFNVTDTVSPTAELTVKCSLDSEPFTTCTSPKTLPNLTNGQHTFKIQATDPSGLISQITTHTWTVDSTALQVTLLNKPDPLATTNSASFSFESNKPGRTTFKCKLDAAAAVNCTSPFIQYAQNNLSEGPHTFVVTGTDNLGRTNQATYQWTVDSFLPQVFSPLYSTSGNQRYVKIAEQQITFTATDSGSGVNFVECSFNNAPFSRCTSPVSVTSLEGSNSFVIIATDGAGNKSGQYKLLWTLDTIAPLPPVLLNSNLLSRFGSSSIGITSSETNLTNHCAVDGSAYQTCANSFSFNLGEGPHVIYVKSIDLAGNESTVVTTTFEVDSRAPVITVNSMPGSFINSSTAIFNFTVTDRNLLSVRCIFERWNPSSWTEQPSYGQVSDTDCSGGTISFPGLDSYKYNPQSGTVDLTEYRLTIHAKDKVFQYNETRYTKTWRVDLGRPNKVELAPQMDVSDGFSKQRSSIFNFASDDPSGSGIDFFECSLNGAPFARCASPHTVSNLLLGGQSFEVRAVDRAGNKSDKENYANENRRALVSWEVVPDVNVLAMSKISASLSNTCSHSPEVNQGGVWCWGNKSATNTTTNDLGISRKPKYVGSGINGVSTGSSHACMLDGGGELWCFGDNSVGQLAISPWGNPRIYQLPFLFKVSNYSQSGQSTIGLKKLTQYHAEPGRSCGIEDKSVRCWGSIWNQGTWEYSPILDKQMDYVAMKSEYHCAIKLGTVWCWGKISNRAGTAKIYSVPTRVGTLVGVQQIAVNTHGACALASGAVSCWGFNEYGLLGGQVPNGSLAELPMVVVGLETNVQQIAGGHYSNCAIKNNAAHCWGVKFQGQDVATELSTSTVVSTPTLVQGLESNVQSIGIGLSHACAHVGTVIKCWGDNSEGQLGDDTNEDRTVPTNVVW